MFNCRTQGSGSPLLYLLPSEFVSSHFFSVIYMLNNLKCTFQVMFLFWTGISHWLPDITIRTYTRHDQMMAIDTRWWVRGVSSHYGLLVWMIAMFHNQVHLLTLSKNKFLFLFPSLVPAPPVGFPVSINGTSICPTAQAKFRSPTLPPSFLSLISKSSCPTSRIHPESAHLSPCWLVWTCSNLLLSDIWTTAAAWELLFLISPCPLTSILHNPVRL